MNQTSENVFDKTWLKSLVVLFLCVVCILTFIGNGFVLWALKRYVSLRKPGHLLLGGLAFADLCMIIPQVLRITFILNRNMTVCVTHGITEVIFVSCVSLHLGCISIERFISIKFALRYDALVTKSKVYISIFFLWFVSIVVSFFIPLAISPHHFESLADGVITLCKPQLQHQMSEMPPIVFGYSVFMLCLFFCLPCAMILFSYTYIFIVSYRQRQKMITVINSNDNSSRTYIAKKILVELKAAKKVFIIQALFIITYFPYFAITLTRMEQNIVNERRLLYTLKTFSLLTSLTSCFNPVIYVVGNEDFMNAFKKLLKIRDNIEQ